jgi:hypothetical protein
VQVRRLGSACVSRVGFGVAPKRTFSSNVVCLQVWEFSEKFAIAGTRSPTRETRALPKAPAAMRFRKFDICRFSVAWDLGFRLLVSSGMRAVSVVFARIEKETTSYDLSQQGIQARYVGHNSEASADRIACLIRTRRISR